MSFLLHLDRFFPACCQTFRGTSTSLLFPGQPLGTFILIFPTAQEFLFISKDCSVWESVSPCLFWGQKVPFLVVQVQCVEPTSAAPLEHPASRVGEDVCSPVSRHSLSYLPGLSSRITAPKMSVFSVLELLKMPHA